MDSRMRAGTQVDFVINDQAGNYPIRTVRTSASDKDIASLVRDGFLKINQLVDPATVVLLREALTRIATSESENPNAELLAGKNIYLRSLLDKDVAFHSLLTLEPALGIARLCLGPQVWIDLDGRMTYPGVADYAVPWHIHMPVVPDPEPPFFCYPHQIHCLLYLDSVDDSEGPLIVLPGSHGPKSPRLPLNSNADLAGQIELRFDPGDAVLIHGNLWHRVRSTRESAGARRLLLLGYVPSWIKGDVGRGVRPEQLLTDDLRRNGNQSTRELLGDFTW